VDSYDLGHGVSNSRTSGAAVCRADLALKTLQVGRWLCIAKAMFLRKENSARRWSESDAAGCPAQGSFQGARPTIEVLAVDRGERNDHSGRPHPVPSPAPTFRRTQLSPGP
jgi:hypothetical protein